MRKFAKLEPQEAVKLASNVEIKKYTDRILKIMATLCDNRADIKSIYEEADAAGVDKKVLKMVIKVLARPIPEEEQRMCNIYLEKLGQLPLFRELE